MRFALACLLLATTVAQAQDYYIETATDWAGVETLKLSFPEAHEGVGFVSGVAETENGIAGFVGSCWNEERDDKPLRCQINYDAQGTVLFLDLWPLEQVFVGGNAGTAVLQGSTDVSGLRILALDERSSIGPPGPPGPQGPQDPQGPKGDKGDPGGSTTNPDFDNENDSDTEPQTSFALSGRVFDSRNSDFAIPGATIRVESGPQAGQTANADSGGRYGFDNLYGTITLEVSAYPHFKPRTLNITVDANQPVDIALDHSFEKPPFPGTAWALGPNLITSADPTHLTEISYVGVRERSFWNFENFSFEKTDDVWVFNVTYNWLVLEFQAHPAYQTREAARQDVDLIAPILGRLPFALLSYTAEVELTPGFEGYGLGANSGLRLFHIDTAHWALNDGFLFLEEGLIHEGAHASLQENHIFKSAWIAAKEADGVFISDYATVNQSEDFAETVSAWFALRYRPERLDGFQRSAISAAIPHRLRYLDRQGFDMSPYIAN